MVKQIKIKEVEEEKDQCACMQCGRSYPGNSITGVCQDCHDFHKEVEATIMRAEYGTPEYPNLPERDKETIRGIVDRLRGKKNRKGRCDHCDLLAYKVYNGENVCLYHYKALKAVASPLDPVVPEEELMEEAKRTVDFLNKTRHYNPDPEELKKLMKKKRQEHDKECNVEYMRWDYQRLRNVEHDYMELDMKNTSLCCELSELKKEIDQLRIAKNGKIESLDRTIDNLESHTSKQASRLIESEESLTESKDMNQRFCDQIQRLNSQIDEKNKVIAILGVEGKDKKKLLKDIKKTKKAYDKQKKESGYNP